MPGARSLTTADRKLVSGMLDGADGYHRFRLIWQSRPDREYRNLQMEHVSRRINPGSGRQSRHGGNGLDDQRPGRAAVSGAARRLADKGGLIPAITVILKSTHCWNRLVPETDPGPARRNCTKTAEIVYDERPERSSPTGQNAVSSSRVTLNFSLTVFLLLLHKDQQRRLDVLIGALDGAGNCCGFYSDGFGQLLADQMPDLAWIQTAFEHRNRRILQDVVIPLHTLHRR